MLDETAQPLAIVLADDNAALQTRPLEAGTRAILAQELSVGGQHLAAGSHLHVQMGLTCDDAPGVTLFLARVGAAGQIDGRNRIVLSDAPLTPGRIYRINGGYAGTDLPHASICFGAGTMIATPFGSRSVETLHEGDLVIGRRSGPTAIKWIGETRLSRADLRAWPHLRPVILRAGALGHGVPEADLTLSQQHRILVRDWRSRYRTEGRDVLVPARALCNGDKISLAPPERAVTYYHILLDHHDLLCANGHWAESLLPTPDGMMSLDSHHQNELMEIFPEIFAHAAPAEPCFPTVNPWEFRTLAQ